MREVILGGGLGGLSAAYYFIQKFPSRAAVLIDSSHKTGGWIESAASQNGLIFEKGPHTIRPGGIPGHNTLKLIDELQLENEIVPISKFRPAARNRMIFAKGKLHLLPSDLSGILSKRPPFTKPLISYLFNDLTAPRKQIPEGDEPVYDFVCRRFGTEIADYLLSPILCGICAGNAKEISVKFLLKSLFEMEQNHGSVIKGLVSNLIFKGRKKTKLPQSSLANKAKQEHWSIFSFRNGMETLPVALEIALKENQTEILTNTKCTDITIKDNSKIVLTLSNGQQIETNHLISSIPARNLSELVSKQHKDLSKLLKGIKTVTVVVVNMYFEQSLIRDEGFGFLVAPKENLPILGVIYDSCCFPIPKGTLFTVMMGGCWYEEKFGENPTEQNLLDTALTHLQGILDFKDSPKEYRVNILQNCIPQYTVGHSDRINKIETYIKSHNLPIALCGSSYYGISINDVILSAKNAVDTLNL